jgi:hypothetical protein
MMVVLLLCLFVRFFIADGNVRENLGRSFVYGRLAWFVAFLVTGCFILAFRLLKRLKRASDVSDESCGQVRSRSPCIVKQIERKYSHSVLQCSQSNQVRDPGPLHRKSELPVRTALSSEPQSSRRCANAAPALFGLGAVRRRASATNEQIAGLRLGAAHVRWLLHERIEIGAIGGRHHDHAVRT